MPLGHYDAVLMWDPVTFSSAECPYPTRISMIRTHIVQKNTPPTSLTRSHSHSPTLNTYIPTSVHTIPVAREKTRCRFVSCSNGHGTSQTFLHHQQTVLQRHFHLSHGTLYSRSLYIFSFILCFSFWNRNTLCFVAVVFAFRSRKR